MTDHVGEYGSLTEREDRCASYNWQVGQIPEVALPKPEWSDRNGDTIMVDACIAPTVEALWAAGHRTLGSCCGHGRQRPSLVLDNGNDVDVAAIRAVIARVDGRRFDLHQWRLVNV